MSCRPPRAILNQRDKRGKSGQSLHSKLIFILLFLLIPTVLGQVYVLRDRFQARFAEELQSNLEVSRAVSKGFETFVQNVTNQELAIGLALTSAHPMSSDDIKRLLLQSLQGNEAISDLCWAAPDGQVIRSSNSAMIGTVHDERDFFREIVNGRDWTVGGLVRSRTTGRPVFGISRGIRDDSGTLLGVVVATIIPEKLGTALSVERSQGGAVSIVDKAGMLVYRHPGIEITWEERNRLQVDLWKNALDGKEVLGLVESYGGKKQIVAITPVISIGWAIGAGRIEEVAMAATRASLLLQFLLFLSITMAVFSLAFVLSRRISSSVSQLRNHALALGRGETQNIAIARGCAELEDLADAFNKMSEDMQCREEERFMAEAALRESEEHFRLVFDKAPIGATVIGMDYRFMHANETFCRITGYSKEELLSLAFVDLTHHEDRDSNIQQVQQVIRGNADRFHLEKRYLRKSGEIIWVRVSGQVIRNCTGEPLHIISMVEDITERKEMEDALREARDDLELRVVQRTAELTKANEILQEQAANIKTLSGLLPICSHCKKIRNDEGYWQQIESYIHQHSGTQFSHGVCPECLKKHYSQYLGGRLARFLETKND